MYMKYMNIKCYSDPPPKKSQKTKQKNNKTKKTHQKYPTCSSFYINHFFWLENS